MSIFKKLLKSVNPKKLDFWEWGLILASYGLGMCLNQLTDNRNGLLGIGVFFIGAYLLSKSKDFESSQAVEK